MRDQTELYRYYDKNDTLLYVGISKSAITRQSQHQMNSHWYSQHTTIKTERFPTRKEALREEKKAIKEEKPKYNIMHNDNIKRKTNNTVGKFKIFRLYDFDDKLKYMFVSTKKSVKFSGPKLTGLGCAYAKEECFDDMDTLHSERIKALIAEKPYVKADYHDPEKVKHPKYTTWD